MEPDQIDILAFSVLRNFEEIEHAEETRCARQLWSDIYETDLLDRINLDFTLFHSIPPAHLDVRTLPYSDAASDFAAPNSVAEALGEDHRASLHPAVGAVC